MFVEHFKWRKLQKHAIFWRAHFSPNSISPYDFSVLGVSFKCTTKVAFRWNDLCFFNEVIRLASVVAFKREHKKRMKVKSSVVPIIIIQGVQIFGISSSCHESKANVYFITNFHASRNFSETLICAIIFARYIRVVGIQQTPFWMYDNLLDCFKLNFFF